VRVLPCKSTAGRSSRRRTPARVPASCPVHHRSGPEREESGISTGPPKNDGPTPFSVQHRRAVWPKSSSARCRARSVAEPSLPPHLLLHPGGISGISLGKVTKLPLDDLPRDAGHGPCKGPMPPVALFPRHQAIEDSSPSEIVILPTHVVTVCVARDGRRRLPVLWIFGGYAHRVWPTVNCSAGIPIKAYLPVPLTIEITGGSTEMSSENLLTKSQSESRAVFSGNSRVSSAWRPGSRSTHRASNPVVICAESSL
jgi:hypothetical protein